MSKKLFSLFKEIALGAALAVLMTSGWCFAGEFSADIVENKGDAASTGKIYVKGDKIRRETQHQGKASITILRMDKGVAWMLMPDSKTYMEMGNVSHSTASEMEEAAKDMAEKKKIGTEKVNGFLCDKIQYIYHDKTMGVATQWFSKELNYPVKMEVSGQRVPPYTTELTNIKVGGGSDAVFELPEGYTQTSMPGRKSMPRIPKK